MQLKEIKQLYRLYMNGVISSSMRQKGATYRVNFGLTMPMLRRIAQQVTPSVEIAEELWNDRGVRESLLLAPMLYPVESFTLQTATRWLEQMPNIEVADFCCKFLFSKAGFASQLVAESIESTHDLTQYVGYRLAYAIEDYEPRWIAQVTSKAIPVAHQGGTAASQAASRFLTEMLLQPTAGAIVVNVLRNNTAVDEVWRQNLIDLYDDNAQ